MIHGLPGYGSQGQTGIDGKNGIAIKYIDDIINFTNTDSISYGDIVLDRNSTHWMYFGDLGFKEISAFNISSAFTYNNEKDVIYSNNEFVFHNILASATEFTDNIQQNKSIINIVGERDSSAMLAFDASNSSLAIDSSEMDFHIHTNAKGESKSIAIDNLYVSGGNVLSNEYGYYIIDEIKRSLTYNKNDKRFSAPLFDNFEYMLFYSTNGNDGVSAEFKCIKSFKDFAIVDDIDYNKLENYLYKIVIKSNINGAEYLIDSVFTLFPEYYNLVGVDVYKSGELIDGAAIIKNNNIEIVNSEYDYIIVRFDKDIKETYITTNLDSSYIKFLSDDRRCIKITAKSNFYINATGNVYNFTIRNATSIVIKKIFNITESKNNRLYYSAHSFGTMTNEMVEVYDINFVGGAVEAGTINVNCKDDLNIVSNTEIKLYTSDNDFSNIRDVFGNIITKDCSTFKGKSASYTLNINTLKKYNKLIVYRKINSTAKTSVNEPTVTTYINYNDVRIGNDSFSSNNGYTTGVIRWKIDAMTTDKVKNNTDYDLRVYNKLSKIDTGKFIIPEKYKYIKITPQMTVENLNDTVYSTQSFLKIGYNKKSTKSTLNRNNVDYIVYKNGNATVSYNGPEAGYMNMDYPLWTNISFNILSLDDNSTFYSRSTARGGNLSPLEDGIIISSNFNINLKNGFKNSDILSYACLAKQTTKIDGDKYVTNSANFKDDDFAGYYDIVPRAFEINNATKTYDYVVNVLTNMCIENYSNGYCADNTEAKNLFDASIYTISKQLVSGEINPDILFDPSINFPPVIGNPEVPTPDIGTGTGSGGSITPGGGFIPNTGISDEKVKLEDSFSYNN